MSHDTNKWAQDQKVGGVGPKATLMCLASFADEEHSCFPGQARIATITEQSVRSVRGHIAALEEAGFLCRTPRMAPEGRGRTSDRYRLHVVDCRSCNQAAKSAGRSDDQPATDDGPTGKAFAGEQTENSQENKKAAPKRKSSFPDAFLLTSAMKEWAAENAPEVDLPFHTRQFADHYRSKGEKRVDWVATWRTWIRNADRWDRNRGRRGSSPPPDPVLMTRQFDTDEEYVAFMDKEHPGWNVQK